MGQINPDEWNEIWMNYGKDAMRSVNCLFKKAQFLERVPKDARILDLGCGTGTLLRVLKQKGYSRLHGLEPEKKLFAKDDLGGIIKHGDCLKAGTKKSEQGRYDVVVMVGVLHHLKDFDEVKRCFQNVHALLREGGSFYTLEPWKNFVRSIMQKLVRDTPVGDIIFKNDKVLLKLEEKELGQWLEMEKDVTAYAPQAGLRAAYSAKDIRYRYIIFEKDRPSAPRLKKRP
jgi:2-polyprenyl-3-methyl-5-hydroxy-6-metoxy-1,4-benzoquinol methylase